MQQGYAFVSEIVDFLLFEKKIPRNYLVKI